MDEKNEVKRTIRHENWKLMYEEYQHSGMKVKDWCEAQGISVKTFYNRLRVLCENNLPKGMSTHPDDRIHISGNDVEVEIPMNVSPELITAILQGIRSY